jgi:hypothetical protein
MNCTWLQTIYTFSCLKTKAWMFNTCWIDIYKHKYIIITISALLSFIYDMWLFMKGAKKRREKKTKIYNEKEKNQRENLKWKRKKEKRRDEWKVRATMFPIFLTKYSFIKKMHILIQIGFTIWIKALEPWPMGFPMVSSNKWGTMMFYRPWPKPFNVNNPLVAL